MLSGTVNITEAMDWRGFLCVIIRSVLSFKLMPGYGGFQPRRQTGVSTIVILFQLLIFFLGLKKNYEHISQKNYFIFIHEKMIEATGGNKSGK